MRKSKQQPQASVDNVYRLDGRVPISKAIPFGLQHVLAMFVSNVAPILMVTGVAMYNGKPFSTADIARLI